jgi:hypothetical protein
MDAASAVALGESLEKHPVTPTVPQDAPGIPYAPPYGAQRLPPASSAIQRRRSDSRRWPMSEYDVHTPTRELDEAA